MGFNDRDNLAFAGGEIPNDEFIKVFGYACSQAKIEPPEHPCQYVDKKGNQCLCEAVEIPAVFIGEPHKKYPQCVPSDPIQLCGYHSRLLKKRLGRL